MGVTDLNWKNHSGHAVGSDIFGVKHAYGTARFFPGNQPPANAHVPALRETLPRRAVDGLGAIGGFILPTDVISQVRSMLNEMRSLEYTDEDYDECYETENIIIDKTLKALRKKSI